jgi:chromosome segregation ATPase
VKEDAMASKRRKVSRPKLPPEVKAAYAELESGMRSLGKSIAQINQDVRKAERQIEADARARIRTLRDDARAQLKALESRRHDVSRTLKNLAAAAGGSWREVKASADAMIADALTTASSVIDRFRNALG